MSVVLLVEDDEVLAQALQVGLREDGFVVHWAATVPSARQQLKQHPVELVILDLTLPGEDGMVLLDELRHTEATLPVIIITARGVLANRLDGLKRGADDYLVKPFAVAELIARIQAVLRRTKDVETHLRYGTMTADLNAHVVSVHGQPLDLSAREVVLLVYLMRLHGRPASREMLARHVWQIQSRATAMDNVIDVSLSRLRRKLAEIPGCPPLLTVRGVGYRLGETP